MQLFCNSNLQLKISCNNFPTKMSVHEFDINLYLHEFFEPIPID